jgi:hypothetical protein
MTWIFATTIPLTRNRYPVITLIEKYRICLAVYVTESQNVTFSTQTLDVDVSQQLSIPSKPRANLAAPTIPA